MNTPLNFKQLALSANAFRVCLFAITTLLLVACSEKNAVSETKVDTAKEKNINGSVRFSSETCRLGKKGKVYFALRHWVFELEESSPLGIVGMSREDYAKLPQSPDPSQPEGCYENPIKGTSFTLAYQHEKLMSKSTTEQRSRADRVSVIGGNPGFKGTIESNERIFFRLKSTATGGCREVADFLECAFQPNSNNPGYKNRENWSRSYKAREEYYQAPFGKPYIVDCLGSDTPATVHCSVTYKYLKSEAFGDVNIVYKFRPTKLPIVQLVGFDKGLRTELESRLVKDYTWPAK